MRSFFCCKMPTFMLLAQRYGNGYLEGTLVRFAVGELIQSGYNIVSVADVASIGDVNITSYDLIRGTLGCPYSPLGIQGLVCQSSMNCRRVLQLIIRELEHNSNVTRAWAIYSSDHITRLLEQLCEITLDELW